MKILVLGGTIFVGRHIVETALQRGHDVTIFNRGETSADLFADIEKLKGNRDGDLKALEGRKWDACIDTCGYVPRIVRDSARLLSKQVDHYTFVSSISVYGKVRESGSNEESPVAKLEDDTVEEIGENYGALKALCETAAETEMPGRVFSVRPGLIGGPWDSTDRFTYWPRRVAAGGRVLAPGRPSRQVQFIDVRDLSQWILRMVETNSVGIYNAVGPEHTLTMEQFLNACKSATNSDASFVWADDRFLKDMGVEAWTELPLWIPDDHEMIGILSADCKKAFQSGLTCRPVSDTVRDTKVWDAERGTPDLKAGLQSEKEQELLSQLAAPK